MNPSFPLTISHLFCYQKILKASASAQGFTQNALLCAEIDVEIKHDSFQSIHLKKKAQFLLLHFELLTF